MTSVSTEARGRSVGLSVSVDIAAFEERLEESVENTVAGLRAEVGDALAEIASAFNGALDELRTLLEAERKRFEALLAMRGAEPASLTCAGRVGRSSPWTDERVALLRRDYPANVPLPEMFQALNALPGSPLEHFRQINAKAARLGIYRAPATRPSATEPVAEADPVSPQASPLSSPLSSPPPAPVVTAAAECQPVAPEPPPSSQLPDPVPRKLASLPSVCVCPEFARRWGAERGIAGLRLDLPRVNAKRAELGLPLFRLESPALGQPGRHVDAAHAQREERAP